MILFLSVQQGLAFYPGVERKRQPESQLSLIKAREGYISSRALCVQLSLCRLSTSLSHSPCFHYLGHLAQSLPLASSARHAPFGCPAGNFNECPVVRELGNYEWHAGCQ